MKYSDKSRLLHMMTFNGVHSKDDLSQTCPLINKGVSIDLPYDMGVHSSTLSVLATEGLILWVLSSTWGANGA